MDNNLPTVPTDNSQPFAPPPPIASTQTQSAAVYSAAPVDIENSPTQVTETSLSLTPQPVVNVLSPRGVEYVFLAITLFSGAIGLVTALLALVNGQTSFSVLAFPTAVLLVSVPIFALLFLRLKNAELSDPSLRLDASKRRTTQFIQIVSFVVCFFTLIGFLVFIFSKISGDYDGSLVKAFLNVLVILIVSGGILAYYWRDEHRSA